MLESVLVFAVAFLISALAGVAALLRSEKELGFKPILSSILNSGLVGLCISLLWYTKFKDNLYFLIGVCVLAGLGGATMVDFILDRLRSGGLNILIGKNKTSVPGISLDEDK